MSTSTQTIEQLASREYKYGFVTEVEQDSAPRGLSEDVVRLISAKKQEPAWLLDWRLKAYRSWLTMKERRGATSIRASRLSEHHLRRAKEGSMARPMRSIRDSPDPKLDPSEEQKL
jgi:hypothetical protein